MNDPHSGGMNTPPGYDTPPSGSGSYPQQGYYQQPQSFRGATRQMFNPAAYKQPGSASWGAASLILSIVGWVTCLCGPVLFPISLILGLVGMIGRKRAKVAAFIGFLLSGIGIAAWVAFFAIGGVAQFQSEEYAGQAGAPVVAAIAEFKEDNGRVPNNITELVNSGYLPTTWNDGLDGLDSSVRDQVEGKAWHEFLRYKPGGDDAWEGDSGWVDEGSGDIQNESFFGALENMANANTTKTTYGLAFIGPDGKWGTYDDKPVNQNPESTYDLVDLYGGDEQTRKIMSTRRELTKVKAKMRAKVTQYQSMLDSATKDLTTNENNLVAYAEQKNLRTLSSVKSDDVGREHLLLVGETQKLLELTRVKLEAVKLQLNKVELKIKRLANQETMAKLAGSKEDLARLATLLEESRDVLDGKTDEITKLEKQSNESMADDWFRKKFGN